MFNQSNYENLDLLKLHENQCAFDFVFDRFEVDGFNLNTKPKEYCNFGFDTLADAFSFVDSHVEQYELMVLNGYIKADDRMQHVTLYTWR